MVTKAPFVRSPYNYDTDEVSDETGLFCDDPSLAQQHQAEEADINTIVRRFGLTGQLPVIPMPPLNADFDSVFDFHTAQNAIVKARESFMMLPADIRNKFANDPRNFVDFVDKAVEDGNIEELRKMGLAVPEEKDDGRIDSASGGAGAPSGGGAGGDPGAAGAGS